MTMTVHAKWNVVQNSITDLVWSGGKLDIVLAENAGTVLWVGQFLIVILCFVVLGYLVDLAWLSYQAKLQGERPARRKHMLVVLCASLATGGVYWALQDASAQLARIEVDGAGTWTLMNGQRRKLGSVSAGTNRILAIGVAARSGGPRALTIQTDDGRSWTAWNVALDTIDLGAWGYKDPGYCTVETGSGAAITFSPHQVGPGGPLCRGVIRQPIVPGAVFARWSGDDWWYFAEAREVKNGKALIKYTDKRHEWVPMDRVRHIGEPPHFAEFAADFEGGGAHKTVRMQRWGGPVARVIDVRDGSSHKIPSTNVSFALPKVGAMVPVARASGEEHRRARILEILTRKVFVEWDLGGGRKRRQLVSFGNVKRRPAGS